MEISDLDNYAYRVVRDKAGSAYGCRRRLGVEIRRRNGRTLPTPGAIRKGLGFLFVTEHGGISEVRSVRVGPLRAGPDRSVTIDSGSRHGAGHHRGGRMR